MSEEVKKRSVRRVKWFRSSSIQARARHRTGRKSEGFWSRKCLQVISSYGNRRSKDKLIERMYASNGIFNMFIDEPPLEDITMPFYVREE